MYHNYFLFLTISRWWPHNKDTEENGQAGRERSARWTARGSVSQAGRAKENQTLRGSDDTRERSRHKHASNVSERFVSISYTNGQRVSQVAQDSQHAHIDKSERASASERSSSGHRSDF